jgi:hypothetical protein
MLSTGQRQRSCDRYTPNLPAVRLDEVSHVKQARRSQPASAYAPAGFILDCQLPLQALPIAPSFQPHQTPKTRRWKVARDQGRVLGLDAIEDLASHLRR